MKFSHFQRLRWIRSAGTLEQYNNKCKFEARYAQRPDTLTWKQDTPTFTSESGRIRSSTGWIAHMELDTLKRIQLEGWSDKLTLNKYHFDWRMLGGHIKVAGRFPNHWRSCQEMAGKVPSDG